MNPLLDPTPKTCTIPSPKPPKPLPPGAVAPEVVAPAPIAAPPPGSVPDFAGMGLGRALDVARTQGIAVEVIGSGRVIDQLPAAGSARPQGKIKLVFSDGNSPSSAMSTQPR
jgi:hypothetical protein